MQGEPGQLSCRDHRDDGRLIDEQREGKMDDGTAVGRQMSIGYLRLGNVCLAPLMTVQ